jgi:hypothetical protein
MDEKKEYIAPEMKIVALEHPANLLQDSNGMGIGIIPRD